MEGKKKIICIIGARPQFIKHAPLELALTKYFDVITIHTGQHYDEKMSDVFFKELKISAPTYMLSIGSFNHGKQTGLMMTKIEEILESEKPQSVLVYGDTNSTLAGALVAAKLHIPVIHVEAGLRSFNKEMPEEINRIMTDHISSILFAPTHTAVNNLLNEGIQTQVFYSGDVMFDAVLLAKEKIGENFIEKEQILVTIHRPYNTDNLDRLIEIFKNLNELDIPIIFPTHPRTKNILKNAAVNLDTFENVKFIEPVSYLDLIKLQLESKCIITDSGGIQKEAYWLHKKCITLRSETEWIETLENGWNTLVFDDLEVLKNVVKQKPKTYVDNLFGVGNASTLIAEILYSKL